MPPRRAEAAGLVELGVSVLFRHPLVRAAVYNAAPAAERRRVHAALAAAAADLELVQLEAWHAAKATVGTGRRRGGPARAGRRPGRSRGRLRLSGQRAGPGLER